MNVQRTARLVPSNSTSTRRVRRMTRGAFTLLEVLLVLAILVVLASLAVGVFSGTRERANIDLTKTEIKAIEDAANIYKQHTGQWPPTLDDLISNVSNVPNRADGSYIKKSNMNDPWGNPYEIVNNSPESEFFIIRSLGQPGKNAEINNAPQQ